MWKVFPCSSMPGGGPVLFALLIYGVDSTLLVYIPRKFPKGMMEDSFRKPRNKVLKHSWAPKQKS